MDISAAQWAARLEHRRLDLNIFEIINIFSFCFVVFYSKC